MRETVTPFPRYDQYTAEQLLDAYQAAPARLRATLAGLTLGELRQHPRPGKWSAMEIVVHMTDSELVGQAAFVSRLRSLGPHWPATIRTHGPSRCAISSTLSKI